MKRWLKEYFDRDRLAKALNFRIVDTYDGYAEASAEIGDIHLNGADMVHGGTIFALADFALAVACNFNGILTVSTNASISFMKAAGGSTLKAVAKRVHETRKLGFYAIDIYDENGIVSRMESTVYITGKENSLIKEFEET